LRRLAGPGNVSIHAPVKGATSFAAFEPSPEVSFNPRPREGGDITMSILER